MCIRHQLHTSRLSIARLITHLRGEGFELLTTHECGCALMKYVVEETTSPSVQLKYHKPTELYS